MRKLIRGIVEFRKNVRPGYRETFARLALGQSPDTLFIACSDSRVVPNLFASADPGDLFVVRNVGNLIAPCGSDGLSVADESEPAAIEFAIERLNVSDIIVCGHTECGAMEAILRGTETVGPPHLRAWLRHGEPSLTSLPLYSSERTVEPRNKLSELNVLQQLEHLKTYPNVASRLAKGTLRIHGWVFDIRQAEVLAYEPEFKKFVLIDEQEAKRLLSRLDKDQRP